MPTTKRKYQGPPCIIGATSHAQNDISLSIPVIRQLGLKCLIKSDFNSPSHINPLRYFEVHNLKQTERWLLVHLPNVSPDQLGGLEGFVHVKMKGFHTDRYDWSIINEIGRLGIPKDKKGCVEKKVEDVDNGEVIKSESGSKYKEHEPFGNKSSTASAPNQKSEETGYIEHNNNNNNHTILSSLCSDPHVLELNGYPSSGVELDLQDGSGEGFAIDCEMCLCGTRQVLSRLAVVRFVDGKQLLDQLVKPPEPITDYVTQFSGITPEMLKGVEFKLEDAQNWLRNNIGKSDILIGHSLNNDLNVLGIHHPNIIDTAHLFPHHLGPAYHSSLRYLARKFLNTDIQKTGSQGHNPVEDATTCERLVKLLVQNGIEYGRIGNDTNALSTKLSEYGVKSTIIAGERPHWDAYGTANHILEATNAKRVDATLRALNISEFVCTTLNRTQDADDFNLQIIRLINGVAPRTLLTLCLGSGYEHHEEIQKLRIKKSNYAKEFRTKNWEDVTNPWTTEDETHLKEQLRKLGECHAFVKISIAKDEENQWPYCVKNKMGPKRRTIEEPNEPVADSTTQVVNLSQQCS